MDTTINPKSVLGRLAMVKAAYSDGKLDDYGALTQSGHNAMHSTCVTAWGPAMRR